jgi:hypothetical protein
MSHPTAPDCQRWTAAVVAVTAVLLAAPVAHASPELLGVEAPFRARIAKEKIRIAAQQRAAAAKGQTSTADTSQCGSQNIGNVDTGGRIGAAPREVFVFAPNAINIVDRGGCR